MQMDLRATLEKVSVLPVVTVSRPEQAIPLAEALMAGGLPCAEITFRSDAAAAAIENVRMHVPEMLVGAGTILTIAQADLAITAGAAFLVAPGFNPAVVDHVLGRGVPMLPGIATPSELEAALARELRVVKVFPAGLLGGPEYLKALAGPYPMMGFVPTGGVTIDNLREYFALPSVPAVGGTWLANADLVATEDWETVEHLAADAAAIVRRIRPADDGHRGQRPGVTVETLI